MRERFSDVVGAIDEYYIWLLNLVYIDPDSDFEPLTSALFEAEFQWDIPEDEHRAKDGLDLRWRFDPEFGLEDVLPEWCSTLEMLVALARRIETEIMWDDKKGDRTGLWFRVMLQNIRAKIGICDSFLSFCDSFQNKSITKLFEKGSDFRLFLSQKYPKNLPKVEIWYQMHAFLLENYDF